MYHELISARVVRDDKSADQGQVDAVTDSLRTKIDTLVWLEPAFQYSIPVGIEWLKYTNVNIDLELFVTEESLSVFGSFTNVKLGIIHDLNKSYGCLHVLYNGEWTFVS